ncbi:MAG: hypothetical protein FWC03_01085 [Treponema sp.]|nr:hypothetical protein [Treponema sp.]
MKKLSLITTLFFFLLIIGCSDSPGNNINNAQVNFSLESLSLLTRDIKSIYLGNLSPTNNERSTINSSITTLAYVTSAGQNAPILFNTSSGYNVALSVTNLEQLDFQRIPVNFDGYYLITDVQGGGYTISTLEDFNGRALIDMKTGVIYDFSNFHGIQFIQDDLMLLIMNSTLYKIDLKAASLQAVALNNGNFLPLSGIYLPFISNNKVIAIRNETVMLNEIPYTEIRAFYHIVDMNTGINTQPIDIPNYPMMVSNITSPMVVVNWGPAFDFPEFNAGINIGILLQDLSGKPWMYSNYDDGGVGFWTGVNSGQKYLTTSININESEQLIGESIQKDILSFSPGSRKEFIYFNSGNILRTSDINNSVSYRSNGVMIIYDYGFVQLTRKAIGINVESVALIFPSVTAEKSFINSDNYLFWLDSKTIKRLWLGTGGTEEIVYTNSRIIDNAPNRNLLTASGRNMIFYQYAEGSVTEVYTYSIDMYNPDAQPIILDSNDMEIINIIELDF